MSKKKAFLKSAYSEMKLNMPGGPPLKMTAKLIHSIDYEGIGMICDEAVRRYIRKVEGEMLRRCHSGHRHETLEGRWLCDELRASVTFG